MTSEHPTQRAHRVHVSVPIIVGIVGLVFGTFVAPLFSDRMTMEHRVTTLEENVAALIRQRIDDRAEAERWRIELRQNISNLNRKMDVILENRR